MSILDKRIVHPGKFVNKVEVDNKNPDGSVTTWEGAYRTVNKEVVGVLVENKEKGVFVLVEQFRPLVNARVMEMIAGLVDEGNTPEQTVEKEVKEETGYIAEKIMYLLKGPKSAGLTNETANYYYAEASGERGEQDLGQAELSLEVIEVQNTISDLLNLCLEKEKSGVLVCPSIWSAVGRAQAMGVQFKK
ncbi:MAG: NUDIX hydrolase [Candidatus Gracilibacteria bacterium]|nr:NUDIX hydrolase [Candidatus Gracilibacteria bacterium]